MQQSLNSNVSIYYHFIKDKKINGTLFYCFEYFIFLNIYKDTFFYIYQIGERDLEFIKNVFKKKYNFNFDLLDKIKPINNIKELYKSQGYKNIFLDVRSFYNIGSLIQNKCYVFVNENDKKYPHRNTSKDVSFYGCYEYQDYDFYNILKLNFDIFREFDSVPDNEEHFISAGKMGRVTKEPNKFINIFKEYSKFMYIHNIKDTNNRFIPECFFYNKDVEFVNEIDIKDSSIIRYNDCKAGNLKNYWLSKEDKIIQDVLNDN